MRNALIKTIENLPKGPQIFGGALWAYEYAHNGDLASFCTYLPDVAKHA